MTIAQIVSTFPPYKGGMGNVAFHYSLELSKLGYGVTVLTPHYQGRTNQFLNFKIKSLKRFCHWGNAACLPQLVWQALPYDVVHLHYPFFGGEVPIYFFKKLWPKKKLVITYHMDVVGRGFLGKFFSWHAKHILPKVIAVADKVLVSSLDYARTSLIADLVEKNPEKFVEIPFGANTKIFYPREKKIELLKKYGWKTEETILLFVAALDRAHYFKGLDHLLATMQNLPTSTKLLVVGRGDLKEYYQTQARELGVAQRVIFVGYINDFDLGDYYNLADIFVLPSVDRSEAFGLVYVEAMACAKPVVAVNLPGVRTVVDDGRTGFLIEPNNLEQLGQRLLELINNPAERQAMGQAGFTKAQEKYCWSVTVNNQLVKVYESLRH